MTVCRYFLKGCCRFGDNCRFQHVTSDQDSYNYNERNTGNYQERYKQQEAGYSNYYRNDYQQRNQRYESRNYYEEPRNYAPERYQDNYHYQSPMSGRYDNQQQNHYKQNYEFQNYGTNKNYASNYRENENVHTQNRFQWLSNDYKRQSQPKVEPAQNKYAYDSYQTSTPKAKTPFSFKVPESEIKRDSGSVLKFYEQDHSYAEIVKEDAKSWELGGQWPFTCYAPHPSKHGFPGFYDVSPEELRYAAYNAEKNNSYESYVQSVQNALQQICQQRSLLQIETPQLLTTLRKIREGEDLYSTSKFINPLSFASSAGTGLESMETAAFTTANSAAAFSFKLPSETDSATKTSAAFFSFKLPSTTEIKVDPQTSLDGDTNIYTPMAELTESEKEQFCASTFVLGKIPTKPPPQGLCT